MGSKKDGLIESRPNRTLTGEELLTLFQSEVQQMYTKWSQNIIEIKFQRIIIQIILELEICNTLITREIRKYVLKILYKVI